jgi:toxin ParE1/3/4
VSFIKRLRKSVDRLRLFPESGWVVEEYDNPRIREIVFGHFRIIYEYDGKQVVILKVIRGDRLLRKEGLESE